MSNYMRIYYDLINLAYIVVCLLMLSHQVCNYYISTYIYLVSIAAAAEVVAHKYILEVTSFLESGRWKFEGKKAFALACESADHQCLEII